MDVRGDNILSEQFFKHTITSRAGWSEPEAKMAIFSCPYCHVFLGIVQVVPPVVL
jgi:hypothetical protein